MKFKIDYCDGQYSLIPLEEGEAEPKWCAAIDLQGEDLERWERFLKEDAYWHNRFKKADNDFVDKLDSEKSV